MAAISKTARSQPKSVLHKLYYRQPVKICHFCCQADGLSIWFIAYNTLQSDHSHQEQTLLQVSTNVFSILATSSMYTAAVADSTSSSCQKFISMLFLPSGI